MRVVICAKEVFDPDAVNNYALAGRLEIGSDGKSLTQTTIPRLINGFDEQAIEAALLLRDAGVDVQITVVSIGSDPKSLLKHAAALGADEIAEIALDTNNLDTHAVAEILAAYIRSIGGADLVLCGRQASDDDQAVVPALVGEILGMPVIPVAKALAVQGKTLRVTRVTPNGDEIVECDGAAVVTISNELGEPRFPTAANKIKARKQKPTEVSLAAIGVDAAKLAPKVKLVRQFVPQIQGQCEILQGASPAELAQTLIQKLRAESVIS